MVCKPYQGLKPLLLNPLGCYHRHSSLWCELGQEFTQPVQHQEGWVAQIAQSDPIFLRESIYPMRACLEKIAVKFGQHRILTRGKTINIKPAHQITNLLHHFWVELEIVAHVCARKCVRCHVRMCAHPLYNQACVQLSQLC